MRRILKDAKYPQKQVLGIRDEGWKKEKNNLNVKRKT